MKVFNIKASRNGGMCFFRIGCFCFSFCITSKPFYGVKYDHNFDRHIEDYLIGMNAEEEYEYWKHQQRIKDWTMQALTVIYPHNFDEHVYAYENHETTLDDQFNTMGWIAS